VCAPHHMMAMPAAQLGHALVADRTQAVLLLPQAKQLPSTLQIASHTHVLTGFKVRLPLRSIWIGLPLDFRMPTNRHTYGAQQAHVLLCPLGTLDVTKEHPGVLAFGPEVLIPNPRAGFVRVSAPRPWPQQGKDLMVDPRKGPLARPVLVILRPAPHDGIELHDQVASDSLLVRLDDPSDGVQEGIDVFLGRRP
jgi:hypothetical protein